MEHSSLSPFKDQDISGQRNQLGAVKYNSETNYQIKQGMFPKEISAVVSNHLIGVVKQQFREGK